VILPASSTSEIGRVSGSGFGRFRDWSQPCSAGELDRGAKRPRSGGRRPTSVSGCSRFGEAWSTRLLSRSGAALEQGSGGRRPPLVTGWVGGAYLDFSNNAEGESGRAAPASITHWESLDSGERRPSPLDPSPDNRSLCLARPRRPRGNPPSVRAIRFHPAGRPACRGHESPARVRRIAEAKPEPGCGGRRPPGDTGWACGIDLDFSNDAKGESERAAPASICQPWSTA